MFSDASFHYSIQGDPRLPVVLFLHGFLGDCTDFNGAIAHLPQFCCISVDLPGHGETVVPADAYTMTDTAKALVNWLDRLNTMCCALVGYSLGGRLALYLAIHYAAKFPRVILESASPGLSSVSERRARTQHDYALATQLEANYPLFLSRWYDQPLFASFKQHPEFSAILQRRSRHSPTGLAKSLRCLSTGQQPSLWQDLPHLSLPMLLLVGERDRKFLAINQEMVHQCPTATLQIIPNCGHVPHLERPVEFAMRVATFLTPATTGVN